MKLTLNVWRQKDRRSPGSFVKYAVNDVSEHMSFLEMLDVLNEKLQTEGQDPVAFEHDCREGICGSCGFMVDGRPHGPMPRTTVCQLHMRSFKDGDELVLEPFRAAAFPIIRDLVVDRGSLDRIVGAGGFVSVNTGSAPEANSTPVPKSVADKSFDNAACIQCGACVAACPNAAAMLFTSAKMQHLNVLPQGEPEKYERATNMVLQMDKEGFGHCTWHGECAEACPKGIPLSSIAAMNMDFNVGNLLRTPPTSGGDGGG
ncbi:MAG: succinate dehydrogenase/fumarate reductase iron-sulfur subunit [Pseudomonadota bacterium]|nr:succinate dehydrogenase/fumarate reductase iron-sulfur subunit [Pseudomonadota bacterium]